MGEKVISFSDQRLFEGDFLIDHLAAEISKGFFKVAFRLDDSSLIHSLENHLV